ncbi:lipase family protein [Aetokthonos hydrillicola Thurmond2011]|jgi:hypothetical protein|uniref:Lipase family protein n=1 Tax=Aetokthonos hydrillicola Thurmond2011 TaxID=2712845 RepID=A0AAP5MDA4_9CYAN|nr:hypothetical protein [Aetokthonos hydrillicola]MBO3458006.1 lipase family protein [Aetokthonos hydrillicola CCALA 1050]MBW4587160.1 lipase family protein [Aetokthonos hydrillicola CCALA 1050]MDR9899328.1 lipase family protein [Aetokthonos hydrillicola Thurmond2011]
MTGQVIETERIFSQNDKQRAQALGWVVNGIANEQVRPPVDGVIVPNPAQELEDVLGRRIDFFLAHPNFSGFIGNWTRVWGPFVYLAQPPFNKYATNVIYVAQKDNNYVVGVAGTNPNSFQNWLIEDLYVGSLANWADYAENDPLLHPKISMGTKIGLDNLLRPHPGSGQTIIDFFTDLLKQAKQNIEILLTGTSLGGALSPVLALALHETKSTWDPNNRATLKVVTFASPTPGNFDFAERYRLRLGNNTIRIWNSLDIVPHAWNGKLLDQIPSLYEPHIPTNPLIEKFVKIGKFLSFARRYTHLERLTPAFTGTFQPREQTQQTSSKQVELDVQLAESLKSRLATENLSVSDDDINGFKQFLQQAAYQHVQAYFDFLMFPPELTRLLTDRTQLPPDLQLPEADLAATESVVSKLLEYSGNPDVDE